MSIVTKSDWTKFPGPAHTSVRVGNSVIPFATNARNQGFTVSSNAIMDKNVTNICRSAYAELWCIGNIHHLLTVEAIKTLVSAFIPSKLDYCKSVFWLPSIYSFNDTLQTALSLSVSIATPLSLLPSHSLIQCSTRISTWTCTLCSLFIAFLSTVTEKHSILHHSYANGSPPEICGPLIKSHISSSCRNVLMTSKPRWRWTNSTINSDFPLVERLGLLPRLYDYRQCICSHVCQKPWCYIWLWN